MISHDHDEWRIWFNELKAPFLHPVPRSIEMLFDVANGQGSRNAVRSREPTQETRWAEEGRPGGLWPVGGGRLEAVKLSPEHCRTKGVGVAGYV